MIIRRKEVLKIYFLYGSLLNIKDQNSLNCNGVVPKIMYNLYICLEAIGSAKEFVIFSFSFLKNVKQSNELKKVSLNKTLYQIMLIKLFKL